MNFAGKIFSILLIFASSPAEAYVPEAQMIISRTARNHGSASYQIINKVRLMEDDSSGSFREVWTVKDASNMHLLVEGDSPEVKGFRKEYIYKNGVRYEIGADAKISSRSLDTQFIERYFLEKGADQLRRQLIRADIFPDTLELSRLKREFARREAEEKSRQKNFQETPTPENDDALSLTKKLQMKDQVKINKAVEPFVRLARVDGTIAWALGFSRAEGDIGQRPGIWIEQDRFLIRKLRLEPSVEIKANEYKITRGLWFPQKRILKWNNQKILINTVSVSKITVGPKTKKKLLPSWLHKNASVEQASENESLGRTLIREFYSRFR